MRTPGELASIKDITEHVARAIMFYRGERYEADANDEAAEAEKPKSGTPELRLVSNSEASEDPRPYSRFVGVPTNVYCCFVESSLQGLFR